jgi:hypothetical protein
VDDPALVRRLERFGQLTADREHFTGTEMALGQPIGEGEALDELHRQRDGVFILPVGDVDFFEAVNLRNIRVVEGLQQRARCSSLLRAMSARGHALLQLFCPI